MSGAQISKMNNGDVNETLILKDRNDLQEQNNKCMVKNITQWNNHVIIPKKLAFISLFCFTLLLSVTFSFLGMLQINKAHDKRIFELENNFQNENYLENTKNEMLDQMNHTLASIQNLLQEIVTRLKSSSEVQGTLEKFAGNITEEMLLLATGVNKSVKELQKEVIAKMKTNFISVEEKIENIENFTNQTETRTRIRRTSNMDCADVFKVSGHRKNGVYSITPSGWNHEVQVYCDMITDGGGWTIFQKRGTYNLSADYFSKPWDDYKDGFGDLDKEFWLGNDLISALSNQRQQVLRVDMSHENGSTAFAKYDYFRVESEIMLYKLHIEGYTGNQKDSLSWHNGMSFTTRDRDNDNYSGHCGQLIEGGWWYNKCIDSNLNGINLAGSHETKDRLGYFSKESLERIHLIRWNADFRPLAATEMKMRPINYSKRCD